MIARLHADTVHTTHRAHRTHHIGTMARGGGAGCAVQHRWIVDSHGGSSALMSIVNACPQASASSVSPLPPAEWQQPPTV